MSYKFSKRSLKHLHSCDDRIIDLFNEVIQIMDCSVICGHRGEEEQNEAYETGKSKLKFPQSKHNQSPSLAVDVVPYPIDWHDSKRFYFFAGVVMSLAKKRGLALRWGGDWNSNVFDQKNSLDDQTFFDLPHFEIIE